MWICPYYGKLPPEKASTIPFCPLAVFAWRGICYSAIARNMSKRAENAVAYAAAPGRIAALNCVLKADDLRKYERPREAIREIQEFLPDLPDAYDFTDQESFSPFETSKLNQLMQGETPIHQLTSALSFRMTQAGTEVRDRWNEVIKPPVRPDREPPRVAATDRSEARWNSRTKPDHLRPGRVGRPASQTRYRREVTARRALNAVGSERRRSQECAVRDETRRLWTFQQKLCASPSFCCSPADKLRCDRGAANRESFIALGCCAASA